jgi:hypothetical protein
MAAGLIDADLGGGVLKKRVGLAGRGKRGGVRTLVATNRQYSAIVTPKASLRTALGLFWLVPISRASSANSGGRRNPPHARPV